MDTPENRLSDYIDALNVERDPEKHRGSADTPELAKLLAAVRLVRSLREPVLPDPGYPQRLSQAVSGNIKKHNPANLPQVASAIPESGRRIYEKAGWWRRRWVLPSVTIAIAGVILLAFLTNGTGLFNRDVAYAMEKAVDQLSSYHGVLETRTTNAAGKELEVRRMEIWYEGDKYAVRQDDDTLSRQFDGTLTVDNGERRWQVRPQDKELELIPPYPPDSYVDLRVEASWALRYPHTVVGSEAIAGRQAKKLKISPPGGLPYFLWIDAETNLPVQSQTALQGGVQTTSTFLSFEPNVRIGPSIFTYNPPAGYRVIEDNPMQLVATAQEAAVTSGLTPLFPQEAPNRIFASKGRIVLDYGETGIMETVATGSFESKFLNNFLLGTAAGGPLEVIQGIRLRWRQNGIEIRVEGPQTVELARQIAPDLTLPDPGADLVGKAQVKVPADLESAKAEQLQADAGHSPSADKVSPLEVSFTFVNLKVSPQGTSGAPKIPYTSCKLVANNGAEAVVAVADGPVNQVYLKRLVRQDTGIWSVVGYDSR